jgi:hypothetical protein
MTASEDPERDSGQAARATRRMGDWFYSNPPGGSGLGGFEKRNNM